ncbi:class I SAM-dependent methyltransferase, partial [Mesorhizobium sp. M7A.F.Ca.US.002.01.1.1]
MLEAEFDQFAREYQEQHAASIRLSGENPDFFARYKIDDVAATLRRAGVKPRRILDFGAGVGNSLGHMR